MNISPAFSPLLSLLSSLAAGFYNALRARRFAIRTEPTAITCRPRRRRCAGFPGRVTIVDSTLSVVGIPAGKGPEIH